MADDGSGVGKFRWKRTRTNKPYDRPDKSLIRRVTDSVQNLIPQSVLSWFGKAETELVDVPGTSRGDLNTNLISYKLKPVAHVNSEELTFSERAGPAQQRLDEPDLHQMLFTNDIQRNSTPTKTQSERLGNINFLDDSLPGPSGHPGLISSTPTGSHRNHYLSPMEQLGDINSDNHSESSESTSGCSSMNPQGERRKVTDENVLPLFGASRTGDTARVNSKSIDNSFKLGHKVLNLSVTRPVDSKHLRDNDSDQGSDVKTDSVTNGSDIYQPSAKRPRFNPCMFGSPVWGSDKSIFRDNLLQSPFYPGKTTFGGVSARQRSLQQTKSSPYPTSRHTFVKPQTSSQSDVILSSTARRILDSLDRMSSPVNDAKRIPIANAGKQSINDTKLTRIGDVSRQRNHLSNMCGPPLAKLSTPPTQAPVSKFTQSSFSQTAVTASPTHVSTPTFSTTAKPVLGSRHPVMGTTGPISTGGGKIRSRISANRTGRRSKRDQIEKESQAVCMPSAEEALPSISLPITTLPIFDFGDFSSKPSEAVASKELPASQKENPRKHKFIFASPSSAEQNVRDKDIRSSPNLTGQFKFSSPLTPDSATLSLKLPDKVPEYTSTGTSPIIFRTGNVADSLAEDIPAPKLADVTPVKLTQPAEKPVSKNWQCSACWVSNPSEKTQCMACETPKEAPSPSVAPLVAGSEPSKWECDTCLVRNNLDAEQCVACEVPRPSEKKTGPTRWECTTCLVQNDSTATQCIACEVPREGSSSSAVPPKSTYQFGSVAHDPFKVSSNTGSGFKFGGDSSSLSSSGGFQIGFCAETTPKSTTSSTATSEFKFGGSSISTTSSMPTASQPTFTFGAPSASTVSTASDTAPITISSTFKLPENRETKSVVDAGFIFGASSKSETNTKSGFVFGSTAANINTVKDKALLNTSIAEDAAPVTVTTPSTSTVAVTALSEEKQQNMPIFASSVSPLSTSKDSAVSSTTQKASVFTRLGSKPDGSFKIDTPVNVNSGNSGFSFSTGSKRPMDSEPSPKKPVFVLPTPETSTAKNEPVAGPFPFLNKSSDMTFSSDKNTPALPGLQPSSKLAASVFTHGNSGESAGFGTAVTTAASVASPAKSFMFGGASGNNTFLPAFGENRTSNQTQQPFGTSSATNQAFNFTPQSMFGSAAAAPSFGSDPQTTSMTPQAAPQIANKGFFAPSPSFNFGQRADGGLFTFTGNQPGAQVPAPAPVANFGPVQNQTPAMPFGASPQPNIMSFSATSAPAAVAFTATSQQPAMSFTPAQQPSLGMPIPQQPAQLGFPSQAQSADGSFNFGVGMGVPQARPTNPFDALTSAGAMQGRKIRRAVRRTQR